jgi:transposase
MDSVRARIAAAGRRAGCRPPAARFEFTFTPKHGSWLNLVEGFFSKLARSLGNATK